MLALAGSVRELFLDTVPLAEERLELRVDVAAGERRCLSPLFGLGPVVVDR